MFTFAPDASLPHIQIDLMPGGVLKYMRGRPQKQGQTGQIKMTINKDGQADTGIPVDLDLHRPFKADKI